jgi:T-complex protein 1 subunit eta
MQVGSERYNTCTIIFRGGSEQFMEETERSLHDAIMIVRRAMQNDSVVAGGGAIDMKLSKYLHEHSHTIAGKEQLLIGAVARAFEVIPRQLWESADLDTINLLNKLRRRHTTGGSENVWYGLDILRVDITDDFEVCVWEPALVERYAGTASWNQLRPQSFVETLL